MGGFSAHMYYGELVCLRALEPSDLDIILKYWSTWELRRTICVPIPSSRSSREEWFEWASKTDPWKDGFLTLAIIDKANKEFLGIARFEDIRSPHRRAELGVSIYDPMHRSKGYGTDATRVMLWIGFHIPGLCSIFLDTLADNERAIRAYEKCGFQRVGLLRKTEYMAGDYHDLLIMDIPREEFMESYPPGTLVGEE